MTQPLESSSILIRDKDTQKPLFEFVFYGVSVSRLCSIPYFKNAKDEKEYMSCSTNLVGGDLVRAALKRRGIDPDSVTVMIWDVREVTRLAEPRMKTSC